MLKNKLIDEIAFVIKKLKVIQIVKIIKRVNDKEKIRIFEKIDNKKKADVLLRLGDHERKVILNHISNLEISEIIKKLPSHDVCKFLRILTKHKREKVLSIIPKRRREKLRKQLFYSKEVVGGIIQREFVQTLPEKKGLDVLKSIKKLDEKFWKYDVYVIDKNNNLLGKVSIEKILKYPSKKISSLMETTISLEVDENREDVVHIFKTTRLNSIPITENGKLVGIITINEALKILEEEHTEDVFKMLSLKKEEHVFSPIRKSLKNRGSWLLINLATAFIAASVVNIFDDVIKSFVLFAVFMPIVAGEGGNATTQTMAIIVRSLALKEINTSDAFRILKKEFFVALINGAIIGIIGGVFAVIWKGSFLIGVSLFLAMIINMIVASCAGVIIPLSLEKLGVDPASSSTVILTTFTDVFGFASFLGIGGILMKIFGII